MLHLHCLREHEQYHGVLYYTHCFHLEYEFDCVSVASCCCGILGETFGMSSVADSPFDVLCFCGWFVHFAGCLQTLMHSKNPTLSTYISMVTTSLSNEFYFITYQRLVSHLLWDRTLSSQRGVFKHCLTAKNSNCKHTFCLLLLYCPMNYISLHIDG